MKFKLLMCILAAFMTFSAKATFADDADAKPDPKFYIFLCFGQSNMEGYPGIEAKDQEAIDKRFQMLAAVDMPKEKRTKGNWYDALPPLCRDGTGLCPVDYFGRTMVANMPPEYKVGVVNVAVAGCKIECFDKEGYKAYAATAANWLQAIVKTYANNPYQYLVDQGKLAQKKGVIKGILLHQGESNSGDKEWSNKVKKIYTDLLKDLDLKAEDVPLLAGQLVKSSTMIDALPKTVPTAHVISSKGCEGRTDGLHFTPAGYRELGKGYAETMLPLLGFKAPETSPAEAPKN